MLQIIGWLRKRIALVLSHYKKLRDGTAAAA